MATDFLDRARFAAKAVAQGGILDRLRLQVGGLCLWHDYHNLLACWLLRFHCSG